MRIKNTEFRQNYNTLEISSELQRISWATYEFIQIKLPFQQLEPHQCFPRRFL